MLPMLPEQLTENKFVEVLKIPKTKTEMKVV